MPQINILNVLQGDNQSTVVDKINYNFDQILSSGGGPQGQQGLIGPTGAVGPQGAQGVQGSQGPSGTKWFVQDLPPDITNITGSNPWTFPTLGDYWLDPDSANQEVYVFTATGWTNTGYGLAAGDIFQKITPIDISGGGTGQGIFISGTASNQSLVLSDNSVNDYTPGGSGISNINFENAKLKIATENSRTKILSFGRADYDITSGGSGTTGIQRNPSIDWDSSASGSTYYDITLNNPGGAIAIKSTAPAASGGVNLYANGEITAQSASDNITLKTDPINKGVFINTANNGGFLEFNVAGSTNQANAPLFANVIGVGIGVGTGGFKQTSVDSRRLAVNGNASIGTGTSPHTSNLFVGQLGTPNYNQGVLFVAGHSMIGHTNPTGDNSGSGVQTTGPSEASGRYPQLFVTSPNYGPGIQIKTKGVNYSPRTIIGDGIFDGSGTGPSITQEFFAGTGYNFTFNNPLISYNHKISNIANSGASGPVFSITTYSNGGTYSYLNAATRTLIETRNSNRRLDVFSNGTVGPNKINLGVLNESLLSLWGPSGSATGGVTIGASASSISPLLGSLTGSTFTTSTTGVAIRANHSLSVTGVQTIGTNNPQSAFNPTGINQNRPIGGNSNLKISRNLYSTTTGGSKGLSLQAAGFSVNNYPNGLEITSFIPNVASTGPNANDSVAIAVGASRIIENSSGNLSAFPATGFFVSNTGENVAIGQYLDSSAAIGVSGAGSDYAIKAKGNVSATGRIYGPNGTSALPTFSFINATDHGMYLPGVKNIAFGIEGYQSLKIFRNDPYATELQFHNANNTDTGQNGAFINWGNYLSIGGWTNGVDITSGTLTVSGYNSWGGPAFPWKWFSGSNLNPNNLQVSDVWLPTRSRSITAAGDIHTLGLFVAGSDERIKDVIDIANGEESLASIKKIEITKYKYKDQITNGDGSHTKVIAQQIREILPEAISESPEFIPNIYSIFKIEKCEGELFAIKIDKKKYELEDSDTIRIIDKDNKSTENGIKKIEEDLIYFELKGNKYSLGDDLFIYGKKVKDFLSVDYDNIMCLNVSATQHLSKIIDSQGDKIKNLENKILKLEELLNRLIP